MMKQAPDAVLVGAASQGSSGNPQPVELDNGVTAFLPCWKAMTPDGSELEGVGIPARHLRQRDAQRFCDGRPRDRCSARHLRSQLSGD